MTALPLQYPMLAKTVYLVGLHFWEAPHTHLPCGQLKIWRQFGFGELIYVSSVLSIRKPEKKFSNRLRTWLPPDGTMRTSKSNPCYSSECSNRKLTLSTGGRGKHGMPNGIPCLLLLEYSLDRLS